MTRLPHIAAAVIVAWAVAPNATAQAPANPAPPAPRFAPAAPRQPAQVQAQRPSSLESGAQSQPRRRRSVVHRYAYPSSSYEQSNSQTAGYRNPGGAGRYLEYYPPGNEFQVGTDPVRVAQFDHGGAPNWDEQRAAQQVGIQKYNSIQGSINAYAQPFGFGYGFGAFGGFN